MKTKLKPLTIILLILTALWSLAIYGFSSDNSEQSGSKSAAVCKVIASITDPEFEKLSLSEQESRIGHMQFYVRKTAHFTAYAILGALTCSAMLSAGLKKKSSAAVAIVYSVAYASTDEFHQTFVSGRSGNITDVLIDSCGAVFGILIIMLALRIFKRGN